MAVYRRMVVHRALLIGPPHDESRVKIVDFSFWKSTANNRISRQIEETTAILFLTA